MESPLDCIITYGPDSLRLENLNNIDTSLIKSPLAFGKLMMSVGKGYLSNYVFLGILDRRRNCFSDCRVSDESSISEGNRTETYECTTAEMCFVSIGTFYIIIR